VYVANKRLRDIRHVDYARRILGIAWSRDGRTLIYAAMV
jgi:hypothetical protein